MNNKNGKIVVWGEGKASRDLLHVDDLMDAVKMILKKQKDKFKLYNVGLGKARSVSDLVMDIIVHSGKELAIEYDLTKPNITTKLVLDISKIKEEIGWEPKISLDEGIKKTLKWYKEYYGK